MGDTPYKPKIASEGPNRVLHQAQLDYMKLIEQKNLERVQRLEKIAKKNRYTAFAIGAGVISIYLYSINAVKQETFLDDFEEPAKISKD